MSQIIKNLASGPVPPTVAQSYVTDVNSPAIPAANVLDVFGGTTSVNNTNGVQTDGSSGGNILTVQLTNRIQGTATTTDGVTPVILTSFNAGATPATYLLDIKIVAYNVTDAISAGYESSSTIRTTGAAAIEISAFPGLISEETTMTGVVVQNQIVGNLIETVVTGLPAKTIHWLSLINYIKVS